MKRAFSAAAGQRRSLSADSLADLSLRWLLLNLHPLTALIRRRVRWRVGEPVRILVTDHDWKDRVVLDISSSEGDPLAMQLLTGEVWEGSGPLAFLLAGGEQLGDDDESGLRWFSPDETNEIHQALDQVSDDQLWSRFDAAEMEKQQKAMEEQQKAQEAAQKKEGGDKGATPPPAPEKPNK